MPTDVASYNSEPVCKTKQGQFSFLVLSAWSVLSAEGSEGYCQVEQNLPVLRKDSAGSETENQ